MNQKSIIAVLGVVVIILIGTIVYFATLNKASQPVAPAPKVAQKPANNQPIATQPAPITPVNTQNYIEVKEFGIKIPIDASMVGDLTYTYNRANTVNFSSNSLTAVDKNCGRGGAGPLILKTLGVPPTSGTDVDYYESRIANGYIKQFNGYFLMFANAQDTCTRDKHVDLEKKLDQAIFAGFKNSVPLTQ
jgi:hypothetical protein